MVKLTTINDLTVIQQDIYIWEVLKENDNSDVLQMTLGEWGQELLTVLYAKGTLSIREFNTTYEGGFILYGS